MDFTVWRVAIALNTSHLDAESGQKAIEQVKSEKELPCTDTVRNV
ncbi:MAG: NAD-dependent epimerase/dehydratase family protein [Coleofasciculus sp. S288]|nr:NAD-dependent epimerase/dehydratase family protein [Coleofasciculus sp. S288]